jgi:hypothetical protein
MSALDDAMKPFKKYRVYTFSQKRELKAIGETDSNGVCHSIAMDWIRRLLFGTASFGDRKYHKWTGGFKKDARQKLIAKHAAMQASLTSGHDSQELAKMDAANRHAKRPFTSLELVADSSTPCRKMQEADRKFEINLDRFHEVVDLLVSSLVDGQLRVPDYYGPKDPVDSGGRPFGAILYYKSWARGHSLACAKANGAWLFFDPNIGEYQTNEEAQCRAMVEANWVAYYRSPANLYNVGLSWVKRR